MSFEDLVDAGSNPVKKTYQTEVIKAAYTGPISGNRIEFKYRRPWRKDIEIRLGANTYVGVDGTEYQNLGNDGGRHQLDCFFDTPNHPADAKAFEVLLLEHTSKGNPGYLEHPREKVLPVVVASVGTIHNVNKDASQTKLSVTMYEQLTLPGNLKDRPDIAVQAQLEAFNQASATDFDSAVVYESPLTDTTAFSPTFGTITDDIATARESVSAINVITETVGNLIGQQANALVNFNAIKTDILNNMDTLVAAPLVLASGMNRLVQFALNLPGDFAAKAEAWGNMYKEVLGLFDGNTSDLSEPDSVTSNRANVQALVATSASAAMMVNAVAATDSYLTKQSAYDGATNAMSSIQEIIRALETIQKVFSDTVFQRQFFGTPSTLDKLNTLSRLCYASIQQVTTNLPATRTITLAGDTQMLQICYDYFDGDISRQRMDALAESNNLSINEMVLVPKGRTLFV